MIVCNKSKKGKTKMNMLSHLINIENKYKSENHNELHFIFAFYSKSNACLLNLLNGHFDAKL